jgi:hypothetical protein
MEGVISPEPAPTLVQTLAPAVASVQQYISPVVVRSQVVPTPPDGFVDIVGSEVLFVIALELRTVAGILAFAIVPVMFAAGTSIPNASIEVFEGVGTLSNEPLTTSPPVSNKSPKSLAFDIYCSFFINN